MRIYAEVKNEEGIIMPGDWKKLFKIKDDIKNYIKFRGYGGDISFELDSNGGDLYINLYDSDVFSSPESLVNELKRAFPEFIFDVDD